VPALIELAHTSTGEVHDVIAKDLRDRLNTRYRDEEWRCWQSYHLSRWTAFRLLNAYAKE
jgi:hypothetical protein